MAGPPELTGIATLKPAKRRAEVEFQVAAARAGSGPVVTLTYHPSRFDRARVMQVEIDGISDPVDSNGRENLVFFEPGDATKLLTVGLHMIVSIAAFDCPTCRAAESGVMTNLPHTEGCTHAA